jgi:hypothetical protein
VKIMSFLITWFASFYYGRNKKQDNPFRALTGSNMILFYWSFAVFLKVKFVLWQIKLEHQQICLLKQRQKLIFQNRSRGQ